MQVFRNSCPDSGSGTVSLLCAQPCPGYWRSEPDQAGSLSTAPGLESQQQAISHLSHLWFAKYSKEGPPPPSTDKQHQHPLRTR